MNGDFFKLKERKLNYCFHNPNSMETSANFILKILVEVNKNKVDRAIMELMCQNVNLEKVYELNGEN